MKKCKNCGSEIDDRLTYCSYKCRNEYVNKNIRNYDKLKLIKIKNEIEYLEKPKKCLFCDSIIPYVKRRNKFCSNSCKASYLNKNKKGMKYKLSLIGYNNIIESNKKQIIIKFGDSKNKYFENPSYCKCCGSELTFLNRYKIFCNIKCRKDFNDKNKTEIKSYKDKCKFKFSLSDYPTKFNFDLITKYGWYAPKNHGNNLNGISRDHIYSVMEGFINKIDPEIISHPANCMLLRHNDNVSKGKKCGITLDELIDKIKNW